MSEELALKQDASLSLLLQSAELTGVAELPADADRNDLSGTEGITQDEIRLPRLAIAQGLSPQMIPTESTYIKGLTLGDMFNDVTGEIYGSGPLIVVPLVRHVTRIVFDPKDKKVPLERDVPANDPRIGKWTWSTAELKASGVRADVPPVVTEFVEFVCLLLNKGKLPEPIMVSIKTTNKYQRKTAVDWTTYISMRGAAIYRGMYAISSKFEKGVSKDGADTNFGVFTVKNAGNIPSEKPAGKALVEFAKSYHERLNGKTIVVNRDGGDDTFDTEALERQPATTTKEEPGM